MTEITRPQRKLKRSSSLVEAQENYFYRLKKQGASTITFLASAELRQAIESEAQRSHNGLMSEAIRALILKGLGRKKRPR